MKHSKIICEILVEQPENSAQFYKIFTVGVIMWFTCDKNFHTLMHQKYTFMCYNLVV